MYSLLVRENYLQLLTKSDDYPHPTYTPLMLGSLALVGSGEFLPIMADFEKSLFDDGIKTAQKDATSETGRC